MPEHIEYDEVFDLPKSNRTHHMGRVVRREPRACGADDYSPFFNPCCGSCDVLGCWLTRDIEGSTDG